MVEAEYNSPVKQMQVKNLLATQRMNALVASGQTQLVALASTYKLILKLGPQVPLSYRGEAHKVDFLRGAVVGYAWANEPLSRVATQGLTFQQLYGELEASLQLHLEAESASAKDDPSLRPAVSSSVPRIMRADAL